MQRGPTRFALLLALTLTGAAAWWDASERKPLAPESGTALLGQPPGLAADDDSLTVVQFNIHHGAPAAGSTDLGKTAGCLANAELAGLNEVAGADWLGGDADQAAALGQALGLAWLFVPSEQRWWHAHFGNGVLSALPARAWQRQPLPHDKSDSYRSRLELTFDWQGATVTFLVTHLDSGPDRDRQMAELAARFAALPAPKILAGDLNAGPQDPVIAAWRADPTLQVSSGEPPGTAPGGVDWIVAEGFVLTAAWRCEQGASDHPAIGVTLRRRF